MKKRISEKKSRAQLSDGPKNWHIVWFQVEYIHHIGICGMIWHLTYSIVSVPSVTTPAFMKLFPGIALCDSPKKAMKVNKNGELK